MAPPNDSRPNTTRDVLAVVRGVLLVAPWLVHLFLSDILLSLLLPLSFLAPTLTYNLSSQIAYLVWRGIQFIFVDANGARITVSGPRLPKHESVIVIANHVGWIDFYLIQQLALEAGMLSRCRWFAKQQLKWVPFLGWGLWAMGMPLISRKWDKDQQELDRVFKGPKQYRWPIWLISYSEGARFTAQRYLEAVQWCKANARPIPKHTLWPRTKGFVSTVKALGTSSSITAVYDLTLAYAHGARFMEAPAMVDTLFTSDLASAWRFHVHAERFDIKELAGKSDAELAVWLEKRWIEKGERLESYQRALDDGKDWTVLQSQEDKKAI